MAKYRQIGSVLKGKEGKGPYIKITEDITLKKGTFLNLSDPRKKPAELLALGVITEEVAAKMQEKADATPEWVKFDITVKND